MSLNRLLSVCCVAALFVALSSGPNAVLAANFTVNGTTDAVDANPGDGVCETAPGNRVCTLRAAIMEANALPGADTVTVPAGTYVLTIPGADEDAAATGDLDITDPDGLTISGAGLDRTVIDGNRLDRVFDLKWRWPDQAKFGKASISALTIRNGIVGRTSQGGGIRNGGDIVLEDVAITGNEAGTGGGFSGNHMSTSRLERVTASSNSATRGGGGGMMLDFGTHLLSNVTISHNSSTSDVNPAGTGAGGIIMLGRTIVVGSTIRDNTTTGSGGGISSGAFVEIAIVNSTIDHNFAANSGGGLIIGIGPTFSMRNVTVGGNQAGQEGGGITVLGVPSTRARFTNVTFHDNSANAGDSIHGLHSPIELVNVILSNGGPGGNCAFTQGIVSLGNNIDSGNTCAFNGPGDLRNTDPKLGPLADNGGPTRTYALLPGSPAIDAGSNPSCPSQDQRIFTRPVDGDGNGTVICDIGAYEYGGVAIPPTPTPTLTPSPTSSPTPITPTPTATPTGTLGIPGPPGSSGQTFLTASAPAGSTTLPVASTDGFALGDWVRVAPGTASQEDHQIAGFGSLLLEKPLRYSQESGTQILRLPAAPSAIGPPGGSEPDSGTGQSNSAERDQRPRRLTDQQLRERAHTNQLGRDDYWTEGGVLAIRCEADPPDVLIANRDGSQHIRLLGETAAVCGSMWVGDYLEIEGVKENEQLFDAEEVTIWRASRRIR